MTPWKQKRARPTIEPIKTNATALGHQPKRALALSRCAACAASPSCSQVLVEIGTPLDESRPGSTTAAGFGSPGSAAAEGSITPLGLDAARPALGVEVPEDAPPPGPAAPAAPAAGRLRAAAGPCRTPRPRRGTFSSSARGCGTWDPKSLETRATTRSSSWPRSFRARSAAQGTQRGPLRPLSRRGACRSAPSSAPGAASPSACGEFDLRELRTTIPEPLPSPRSPNFDRSSLLAPFSTDGALLSPAARAGPTTRRATAAQRRLGYGGTCPSTERRSGAGPQPIPIHLPYARAFLPSLAAIMMSALVRSGDRIDLPMPHPKAWVETAAYVYTGEEELLTATVKLNVERLGGKV